jgi:hypothetical protein
MIRHPLFILALSIIGISGLQWIIIPMPTPAHLTRLAEEPWKIPNPPNVDVKESLATLNSASLWGKQADIALAASLSDPAWRFLGVIVRGKERHVILKIDGQPEQTLAPGDTLPGGSQILSIESDRLCLLINGQKRSLAIYSPGPLSGIMPQREEDTQRTKRSKSRKP